MNKRKQILDALDKNVRFDGRKKDEYRKIEVIKGVSATAEGSATVKIGDTEVMVGVKLGIGTPYPDSPDSGNLIVSAEFLPLASPEYEPGPPDIDAIELARVVDRGIREAKAIDVKKLCIEKGEKIWEVSVDICTINTAGNLFDAATLATLAALMDTKFPKYENDEIDYKVKTDQRLPLEILPVAITVIKIGNHFLVDPLPEEEEVLDARLTVTLTEDGSVCALQKGGDQPLTVEQIDEMIGIALEKSKEFRKLL
ncbi:RNA-binding protein [Candidatus Woesearchaeota archaeon]|nr:MAG: RNA-binding protein [Candidatus Woesearchaeota archaeon]